MGEQEIWLGVEETPDQDGGVLFGLEAAPDLGPVVRRAPNGELEILAPDLFEGDGETLLHRFADLNAPPEPGYQRQRLSGALAVDLPEAPIAPVILRGGLDGATPLAELREIERHGVYGRGVRAFEIPGAEDLGPVVVQEADGDWRVLRPGLFRGAPSSQAVAERVLHRHEVDWEAGGWVVDDVVIEPDGTSSYDAEAEEITVTLRNKDGDKEERRLPVFALPRVPDWSSELYDLELTAPRTVEFFPTGLNRRVGDGKSDGRLRTEIGDKSGVAPGTRARPRHEYPPISTLQAAFIKNGVYGVVGRVPEDQNGAHGGLLRGFYKRHGLKEGDLFLYVHVGLDPAWIEELPGDKLKGRWARSRPFMNK